ncbi:MAG: hypothetical protein ABIP20_18015 [Chthoniobacteraceae bacterium]
MALFLATAAPAAFAGEPSVRPMERPHGQPADLSLANFFATGWDEPWARRSRGEGTPDMSLLRVQTNFLAQLFRTDFTFQQNTRTAKLSDISSLSGTLEYALNRRLMLAIIGNERWFDSRTGADREGAALAAFARIQLVDAPSSSLAATLRVGLPSHDLGEKETVVSLALAGWQDLAPLGLRRTGLYWHVQEETLAGPTARGSRRNDFTFAVSLAKTWTRADDFFGNATTFVETYGRTDLDGADRGRTLVTLTPGVRATFAHRHIVMAGVEFPVTDPRPFDRIVRLTYIVNF